jgi:hypothetical protein
MRSDSRRLRLALLAAASLLATPVRGEVIERIVAVVDERPLLLSEVLTRERLRDLERAASIEALIDEELMFREAARLPQASPTDAEAESACANLKQRAGTHAAGLSDSSLCRIARREATILKYAAFRFAPQVRVEDDELRQAYDTEYAGRVDAPGFAEAAPALRASLTDRRLGDRIEAWVTELRAAARIRYNP